MAIIQSGQLINASNVVAAWNQDAVSSGSRGDGANVARGNSVNFADGILWGPGTGGLTANYPDNTKASAWAPLFGGLGRSGGGASGNAWAVANVAPGDFKKYYGNPNDDYVIFASNYSNVGLPASPTGATLYNSAKNFLTINWCTASQFITGDLPPTPNPVPLGTRKASFSTPQFANAFTDAVEPRGTSNSSSLGSVAYADYGNSSATANPVDQSDWGINNYFYAIKSSFNSRPATELMVTVCHGQCHSSCHSQRGRR